MKMKGFQVQNDSGDRNYFTMLPNYILNHSTANDQALYMQMKRYAGEKGECFASEATLRSLLGIGRISLKKALDYLLKRGWIKQIGYKVVQTKGGSQKIKVYSIVDIWQMNSDYYKGMSKTAPLTKGVSETAYPKVKGVSETTRRGVQNDIKGVSETASNKNPLIRTREEEETIPLRDLDAEAKRQEVRDNIQRMVSGKKL